MSSDEPLSVLLASPRGFYEQLALEDLGHKITVPAKPAPLTQDEIRAARQHPGPPAPSSRMPTRFRSRARPVPAARTRLL